VRTPSIAASLASAALTALAASTAHAAGAPVIAVFQLEDTRAPRQRLSAREIDDLTGYLSAQLAQGGAYKIVPPEQIKSALREKKVDSYRACFDEKCQIEIGKELAAEKTLATRISQVGTQCLIVATVFDLRESASERAATFKGACAREALTSALERVAGELRSAIGPRAGASIPSPIQLEHRVVHLGDNEVSGSGFRVPKPEGARWSAAAPAIPSLPEGCAWSLALRALGVVPSSDRSFREGAYRDPIRIDQREVALLNAYVADEDSPIQDVVVPLDGVALAKGSSIEIAVGTSADKKNLDDIEIEDVRLSPLCARPGAIDGTGPQLTFELDTGSRHLGDNEVREYRSPKPEGASWRVSIGKVPPISERCVWTLLAAVEGVVPDTDPHYDKGGYRDEVLVGGRLIARLNAFTVDEKRAAEVRIPLFGATVQQGSILEITAGKDAESPNLDDFQIENLRLQPDCRPRR
jgi:hypothetical protein